VSEEIKPAIIFNDDPVREPEEGDYFYFPRYANTISDIIAYRENRTPLTIGIYGSWGTGKTSLMRLIAHNLKNKEKYNGKGDFRKCKTVWFQAWKYADEEKILAALIEEIFKTMERDNFFQSIKANIEKITKSLSTRKVISKLSDMVTTGKLDVTEFFTELSYKEKLSFVDTFDKFFADLIYCYILDLGMKVYENQKVDDKKGVLTIFIDDLDRCPKDRIPKVLEAVKLFLDKEGCVFVIGADKDIITEALTKGYPTGADRFMEKIVQLSFTLPKMDDTSGRNYLASMCDDEALGEIAPLLIDSLDYNPRRIKRLINDYNFMKSLAENRYVGEENPIQPEPLLRWLVILNFYSGFAERMRLSPEYVRIVQEKIEQLEGKLSEEEKENWMVEGKLAEINPMGLEEYLKDKNFVLLIKNFPIEKDKIEPYISFTTSVVVVEEGEKEKRPQKSTEFDKYTNPVPGGKFTIEGTGREMTIDDEFEMGIYPVTNSQYERFIGDGGYIKQEFWSPEGWKWLEKEKNPQPLYWNDEKWNQSEYPVVGVCWYEAEAYCNWLSKTSGGNYRLPSEAEWGKTAGWDEKNKKKRVYPWGDEFDKEKCNTYESKIGRTSPVNKYPQGVSPYGCYDMAGNVWEWIESWYDEKEKTKVLRGGSWFFDFETARCAFRFFNLPNIRFNKVGFRCVRTKTV
jgi:formylglycine-generating enzyme required for sulfatase activity